MEQKMGRERNSPLRLAMGVEHRVFHPLGAEAEPGSSHGIEPGPGTLQRCFENMGGGSGGV